MGAWIEIDRIVVIEFNRHVAPLMGAWIEIIARFSSLLALRVSRPSWARGLKLTTLETQMALMCVASLMGAWIEIFRVL